MKDLTNIPQEFHILFSSDYNKGNDSKCSSMEKSVLNELYLKYNKWSVKKSIQQSKPIEEAVKGGFDGLELFS